MNANELAEIQAFKTEELTMWERNHTATMLRQQQAEIEALKAGKIRAYDNGVEDGRKPDTNNKPVAWFYAYPDDIEEKFLCSNSELIETMKKKGYTLTPLYTHPSEHDLGIAEAIGFEKGHKSATAMIHEQQAEIEALKKQLAFMEGEYPEPTIMAKMMEVDLVRQQQAEIEYWKEMFDKAMKAQEK